MDGNPHIYATRFLRIANSRCSSNSAMRMMITPSPSHDNYTKSWHISLATAHTHTSYGSSRSTIVHVFGTISYLKSAEVTVQVSTASGGGSSCFRCGVNLSGLETERDVLVYKM
jgi:hypothetical protein